MTDGMQALGDRSNQPSAFLSVLDSSGSLVLLRTQPDETQPPATTLQLLSSVAALSQEAGYELDGFDTQDTLTHFRYKTLAAR